MHSSPVGHRIEAGIVRQICCELAGLAKSVTPTGARASVIALAKSRSLRRWRRLPMRS